MTAAAGSSRSSAHSYRSHPTCHRYEEQGPRASPRCGRQ